MGIIAWIVLGLIAGGLANYIMKGGFGLIGSLIAGVLGAVVGGWFTNYLFNSDDVMGINLWSILVSIVGAIIVVGVAKVVLGRGGD
jgi:uncharacterized membrane protein YeaQ/YmgE (transglycosylase-associated protein family)